MRFQLFIHLLLSAFTLITPISASKRTKATHRREKIVLYVIYDILCDVLGADVQQMIYPQDPSQNWVNKRNLGFKREDKRFVYQEFISRSSGYDMRSPENVQWDIRSPADVGIQQAVDDMDKRGIGGGTIAIDEVSPSMKDWKNPTADVNRDAFVELYEKALAKYDTFSRSEVLVNEIGDKRRALLSNLMAEIYHLRREETWDFIAGRIKKMDIDAVAPLTDSAVPDGEKYYKLDVAATLDRYTDSNGHLTGALAKLFPTRRSFADYVDVGLKDPDGAGWFKDHNKHSRVITVWFKGYARSLMSAETLAACGLGRNRG